eukprot:1114062-Pyramimonas_sp.AAC.1
MSVASLGAPATLSSSIILAVGACHSLICSFRIVLLTTTGSIDLSNRSARPADQSDQSAPPGSACAPASIRVAARLRRSAASGLPAG